MPREVPGTTQFFLRMLRNSFPVQDAPIFIPAGLTQSAVRLDVMPREVQLAIASDLRWFARYTCSGIGQFTGLGDGDTLLPIRFEIMLREAIATEPKPVRLDVMPREVPFVILGITSGPDAGIPGDLKVTPNTQPSKLPVPRD